MARFRGVRFPCDTKDGSTLDIRDTADGGLNLLARGIDEKHFACVILSNRQTRELYARIGEMLEDAPEEEEEQPWEDIS